MGIEPMNAGSTIRCVNHFAMAAIFLMAGVAGIEPALTVLETVVLPLNYTPIITDVSYRMSDVRIKVLLRSIFSNFDSNSN